MPEPNPKEPDDLLLDVAVAIADGTAIDWDAAHTAEPPSDTDSMVTRLRRLERLVRGHEALRSRTSADPAPAHDTVLTAARRATGVQSPVEVKWGPLVILDKIGRGSFGDVYRAWDPRLEREVALKLVPERTPESVSSPVVEEGRLLARVKHPNVLTVHGAERIDGRVGIWTEYVRGETLAGEIARRGPVTATEAAQIGIEVCRALEAVHAASLLHRDIKAQNIFRDETGRLVLGDFGTGVEVDEQAAVAAPQIAGTPLYLAPEIFDGRPATVASDLYSVGVLLYFLVTGTYPVPGRTMAEVRRAHESGARVPLRTAAATLPAAFVEVVDGVLAPDRHVRFPAASAVESALAATCANQVPPAAPGRLTHSRWRRMTAVAAGLIAVAALGVFAARNSGRLSLDDSAEQPRRTKSVEPEVEPATTPSARAFELYSRSYQLGRQGKWPEALDIARQSVAVDPDFASGWMWLAWAVRNTGVPSSYVSKPGEAQSSSYRSYAERALRLAQGLPEWERYWITGSYYSLLGEHTRAMPQYRALLRLRPDHFYGNNNLRAALRAMHRPEDGDEYVSLLRQAARSRPHDQTTLSLAAVAAVVSTGRFDAAEPHIEQLQSLVQTLADTRSEQWGRARLWLDFTTAYCRWASGDVAAALAVVNGIRESIDRYPGANRMLLLFGIPDYYVTLGRAADASRFAASLKAPLERQLVDLSTLVALGDWPQLGRRLAPYTADIPAPWQASAFAYITPLVWAETGHVAAARRYIQNRQAPDWNPGLSELIRGFLLARNGDYQSALEPLERGVAFAAADYNSDYWRACEALADTQWRLGRQSDAIATLETCRTNRFRVDLALAPLGQPKRSLDLRLASLYRQVRRADDARGIEEKVRGQLTLADADFSRRTNTSRSRP